MENVMRKMEKLGQTEPELEEHVETVSRDLKTLGRLAGKNFKDKMVRLRKRGEQFYNRAKTRSRSAVERHPIASLVTAAGVGALAGLLLRRR